MKNVLIISPDNISEKMAGPSIRYWNLAIQLSNYHNVHLMTPNKTTLRSKQFVISTYSKKELKKSVKTYDAVLLQGLTLFKNSFLKYSGIPLIIDLYDPFVLEMLEERTKEMEYDVDLDILFEQIRCGDYFICASERQRDFWIGNFIASRRINLKTYLQDVSLKNTMGIVPFGMDTLQSEVFYNPFERFNDKKVLLWGGGLWNWLDPGTLLLAFSEISKKRPDVILFFMGTKHPNNLVEEKEIVTKLKKMMNELDIQSDSVVFNDWVPYQERQCYYSNAFVAITTYFDNLETRFSFRTRVLDYFWCDLPMILTKGDTLSTEVEKNGCGLTITSENVDELVLAIERMLEDDKFYNECKVNIRSIKGNYSWENSVKDLINICNNPSKHKVSILESLRERVREIKLKAKYAYIKFPLLFRKNAFQKISNHIKGR